MEREELQMLLMGGSVSFGIKSDFLNAAGTKAVEGLVCKGSLGGLCGHGSLSGMNDVLKNMDSEKLNNWLNVTQFDIVRLSWKIVASSTLKLKFQTKLTINFSGMLSFLNGSIVDVNIMVPLDLHQPEPGQVLFSVKSCQAILTGIQVNTNTFSTMMEAMMKWSLNVSLPNILCPVIRFWFYIINQQMAILKNIASFGMLGDNNLPSTPQPMLYERSYYMDFKVSEPKMFQLGSLVVLCGLLIGTSESLLNNVGSVLNNLNVPDVNNLNVPAVNNLNVPNPVSGDVLQNLNVNVDSLQKTTDWLSAKGNILDALNTLDVGKLNLVSSQNSLGLRINKFSILNVQASLSSDLKGIDLKLPVVVDASLNLPLIGSVVDVVISLDLITSLSVQTNAQTGLPTLTIGKCSSDTDKISISLLGRRSILVNSILDSVSGLLTNTVSGLLRNQICPLVQFLLQNLNIDLTQNLVSTLQAAVPL
ncbi:BPI fold-containing family A member 2 [Sigmodon hispidus]